MKENVFFNSGTIKLEACLDFSSSDKGVVITHPHPLYGGSMTNSVVDTIKGAYSRKGFTTLCFNFRGVGLSGGQFDNGRGETEDVIKALGFLSDSGIKNLCLSGYSFGTWVNARIDVEKLDIRHMTMASPPVAFMDFTDIRTIPCPLKVVTGSLDEIAPHNQVESLVKMWNSDARFNVLDGADHFYYGFESELAKHLSDFI